MKYKVVRVFFYLFVWVLFSHAALNLSYAETPTHTSFCVAQNFDIFFQRFTEDKEVQLNCTSVPLEKLLLLENQEERVPTLYYLKANQLHFPLIVNEKERLKQGLRLKIQLWNNLKAKVTLYKPDTGYQIVYYFKNKNMWKLIKIEDWSI